MKHFLKGWRTRLVAAAHILTGAIMVVDPSMIRSITSDDPATRHFGYVVIGQGIIIFLLRQVTTTPPGKKI